MNDIEKQNAKVLEALEREADQLAAQIATEEAKDHPDLKWRRSAKYNLKRQRRAIEELKRVIKFQRTKERRKFGKSVERQFMQLCRERYPDQFHELLHDAQEQARELEKEN